MNESISICWSSTLFSLSLPHGILIFFPQSAYNYSFLELERKFQDYQIQPSHFPEWSLESTSA